MINIMINNSVTVLNPKFKTAFLWKPRQTKNWVYRQFSFSFSW